MFCYFKNFSYICTIFINDMKQIHKLIVVTRQDLEPGYQLAQSGHAIAQFMLDHPEQASQWNNNFLICLSVENENQLKKLMTKLHAQGIMTSHFLEPDIGFELTAISFEGSDKAKKLTSHLQLALKSFSNNKKEQYEIQS